MKNFKKNNVLVTGGAVRIGREICRYFAAKNFNVIIHCNKSTNEAEELLTELNNNSLGFNKIIQGDLTLEEFIYTVFKENEVNILINNASVFQNKPIAQEDIVSAKYQFEVNFWAPYNLMKSFKEFCKTGLIINILDCSVDKNNLVSGSYLLSKKSLAELTKLAALQWAPDIRVNGISPGFVLPPPFLNNSKMEKSIFATPLKKSVNPVEIAKACMFLTESDSITGEIINIDGGVHL